MPQWRITVVSLSLAKALITDHVFEPSVCDHLFLPSGLAGNENWKDGVYQLTVPCEIAILARSSDC